MEESDVGRAIGSAEHGVERTAGLGAARASERSTGRRWTNRQAPPVHLIEGAREAARGVVGEAGRGEGVPTIVGDEHVIEPYGDIHVARVLGVQPDVRGWAGGSAGTGKKATPERSRRILRPRVAAVSRLPQTVLRLVALDKHGGGTAAAYAGASGGEQNGRVLRRIDRQLRESGPVEHPRRQWRPGGTEVSGLEEALAVVRIATIVGFTGTNVDRGRAGVDRIEHDRANSLGRQRIPNRCERVPAVRTHPYPPVGRTHEEASWSGWVRSDCANPACGAELPHVAVTNRQNRPSEVRQGVQHRFGTNKVPFRLVPTSAPFLRCLHHTHLRHRSTISAGGHTELKAAAREPMLCT